MAASAEDSTPAASGRTGALPFDGFLPGQPAMPVTVVPGSGTASFAIGEPGGVEVFDDFGRFAAALAEKPGAGCRARAMSGNGHYDPDSFVLTARQVGVMLIPAG